MNIATVEASELPRLLQEKRRVIDVRSPGEYHAAHVTGAELHPLDQLDPAAFLGGDNSPEPVYILCQSGGRARKAAEQLAAAGHPHPVVVEGGTTAAIEAGIGIERGRQIISIERQVRIAAGLLVVLGTLGGVLVNPWFLLVPGFVGAGLAFAGITDTCGMGMLLTRMPWNR